MLELELTKLENSPPELRAGASVTVDTAAGLVKLSSGAGVEIAKLSAEQLSSIASSSAAAFNPSSPLLAATVRTVRRETDAVSSVTIRITPVQPQHQAATRQNQHQNQPRRSAFFFLSFFENFSIDGFFLFFFPSHLTRLSHETSSLSPSNTPALATSKPAPESTLDPDELGCRLTKSDLDALASDPKVREALQSEETRRAVERALSAADNGHPSAASAALESEGEHIAGLATAVLDCLERAQEKETK